MKKKHSPEPPRSAQLSEAEEKALFLQTLDRGFDVQKIRQEKTLSLDPIAVKNKYPKKDLESKVLDLHGLSLAQAQHLVRESCSKFEKGHIRRLRLTIVTGKGRHSQNGGPILIKEMHAFASQIFRAYLEKIDEDPAASMISGVGVRGEFTLILSKN